MNKREKIEDLRARGFEWAIPWEAVELIAHYEDCQLRAYLCPANKPTIGWGETDGIQMGMVWTKEQADTRFNQEVNRFTKQVEQMLTAYTTPFQLGAMVALAYNIGLTGLRRSTVLRAHNAGDHAAAARAFGLWNKARINGKLTPLRGLTARRTSESALYLREEESPYPEPNVQAVEPESSLAKSPISLAGASSVAVGGTALTSQLVQDTLPVIGQLQQAISTFNINPMIVLGLIGVGIGVVVWKWRKQQRDEGWA